MKLQEAINRSSDNQFNYPDIIDVRAGLIEIPGLNVVGIPSWDRKNNGKKRKAILEIRTFKGISSNAIHFYGKIVIDGVYQATLGNLAKPRNLTFDEEKQYPLLNYHYDLKIKRPLTQHEIDSDPQRWYAYDEGDMTEGYENIEELINDVKDICRLRFSGEWNFSVQYPRGNREALSL